MAPLFVKLFFWYHRGMDTTLIHADIFFFITSISVVVLTVLFIVAMVYIIRILKNASQLSDTIKREGEYIAEDISDLREAYTESGMKLAYFLQFLAKMLGTKMGASSHRKHRAAERGVERKKSSDEN